MIKKYLFYLTILISIIFGQNVKASNEIKIIFKINNEIITNQDIVDESNYLISLNNQLQNLSKKEITKIAEESLIREKIKLKEIKRNFNIQNFNDDILVKRIIKDFYTKLNLNNEKDFEIYLQKYDVSIAGVIEKIKIEVMWNQMIANRFSNQINIDEDKLKKKILDEELNIQNIVEFDLAEIVFQANNQNELNSILSEIEMNIKTIGFNSTANKFSISSSAKFGGKIGKIKEGQLSKNIKNELKDLIEGQYTRPIKVSNGFLILFINKKEIIKSEIDKQKMLKEMVDFERNNQFERFSQIYYNKIKLDSEINE